MRCISLTAVLVVWVMICTADRSFSKPGDPCTQCSCRSVAAAQDPTLTGGKRHQWRILENGQYKDQAQAFDKRYTHDNQLCEAGERAASTKTKSLPIWEGDACSQVCAGSSKYPVECYTGDIAETSMTDYHYVCIDW